jgi:hypothetical protein
MRMVRKASCVGKERKKKNKKVQGEEKATRMWQKWVGEDFRTCCRFPSTLAW